MLDRAAYLTRVWLGTQVSPKFLPAVARPLSAHVKLTENCQARCISCNYWKTRWHDAIDTERAIDLINQIDELGIRSLRFTGGEPLLRRDMFRILERSNTSRFRNIIVQTNGLLLKKLHKEINASPITSVCVSVDGLKQTNDRIRGIKGYFDLAVEGMALLEGKSVTISVTLNRISAGELEELARTASGVGADVHFNILTRSLFFTADADTDSMWPEKEEITEIRRFVRDTLRRPPYEVDYITRYYNKETLDEPPCVLGMLQVFVLSNGDVLTGCYPLRPVGNILRQSLGEVLASEEYHRQSVAMIRRECPGCTCGIESSLAMKHAASSAFFELGRLLRPGNLPQTLPAAPVAAGDAS
jgi:MoaA/NifB/PqqE/SkfB family radical SAM enzyme